MEKYVGNKANKKILPDQPGDVPRTCASTEKAKALLGYTAKIPFDEGIRRTVLHYNEVNHLPNSEAVERAMAKVGMPKIVSNAELKKGVHIKA